MTTLHIRGGQLIDASQGLDRIGNLLIADGKIVGIDQRPPADAVELDATGLLVCPGLIDLHASLGEPGFEEDETIATGTASALAGGFTSVAVRPDTEPVVDNRAAAEFIRLQGERAGHCHIFPLGAVTKKHAGEELAEIGLLVEGQAVGFTDAKQPIANAEIMRRALQYSRMFNKPILNFPQVPELLTGGLMHEGFHSTLLGLRGIPAAAEEIMVIRDIALAEMTGGHIHLMCLSTRRGVDAVRRAKTDGVRVTADVTAHHLALTDESMRSFDTNHKVLPPLRSRDHIDALIAGLQDGTIDAICSDHEPSAEEKKLCELDQAPFGIVGLESVIPVCGSVLVEPGHLTWAQVIERLTTGPAGVLGLSKGTLQPDADADITLIDPKVRWSFDAGCLRSASSNTPFNGFPGLGRVVSTIVSGHVRYRCPQPN